MTAAAQILIDCIDRDGIIYACGNGGSAAIANHLLCDFQKGIQTDTSAKPRVVSLSCNLEIITAIGNDIGYEDIFVYQLRTMARPGDVIYDDQRVGKLGKHRARRELGKEITACRQSHWLVSQAGDPARSPM